MSRNQQGIRSRSVKTQHDEQSLSSRLQKLRTQIYQPYRSILNIQNQQKITPSNISSISMKPSKKNSFLLSNKSTYEKSIKFPSLNKKKSSLAMREIDSTIALANLVPDPYLNGKIKSQRQEIYENMRDNCNQYKFLKKLQKYQLQFLQNCSQKKYNPAEQIISIMLNYTIDLNLIDYLCFSLRILGDFNFQLSNIDKAFFYYNQCRKCSHYIGQYQFMAESLMKMAECAVKANFNSQAVRFLKKALQYIWYYDMSNLQLRVYDEIGRVYYMMGDAQNAKNFHHKYFTGGLQPKESSIRLLSIQSLILEGLNKMKIIRDISSVFLWMISIPVKNCNALQQFNKSEGKQDKIDLSPRKNYQKDMRYFQQFKTLKQAIYDVFNSDLFKNQLGQMHMDKIDWAAPIRNKKYLSFDIQRNNLLKAKGIPFQNYFAKQKPRKVKITIKSKFKTETSNQALAGKDLQTWLQSITSQAIKRHKNNSRELGNKVCVRGLNQYSEPKTAKFRILYNQYFDFTQSHSFKKIKTIQNDKQQ